MFYNFLQCAIARPYPNNPSREFLNIFEKGRKANREKASDPSQAANVDNELMTFDRLNRSPDDERSHVDRYKILEKRFNAYLEDLDRLNTLPTRRSSVRGEPRR